MNSLHKAALSSLKSLFHCPLQHAAVDFNFAEATDFHER